MKKLLGLAAVLSCTSLFAGYVPPLGQGQSETWTGAAGDGSWNNSQNWSGKVLPSATIGVYIPGETTIDVEGNSAANWIETTGSGSVLINGDGTLQIAGLATTNGASLSFGCNLVPAAMLHSVGAFTIANGGTFSLSYPWVESGDVTVQAGANMTLQGSNNSPHMPISGNLINRGTISVVDCPLTVAGNFIQDGALTVSNGYATAETWTTGGSINLQNSQVIGNGPWTVNGVTTIIFLAATNRFTFPSSYGQTWSGSVSIEGWVDYPNNRIQVGNNPCGLSVAQLNSIAFQGVGGQERNGCLNAYGYVTPNTNGLLPPFVFSNQPLSEVNVAYGGNLQLSVSTSRPSSTEYQWQLNGTSIPGAIGPNYINRGVTGAADGDYACVVTSDDLTMTSTVANVVVGPKLLKGPLPQKANGNGPFEFTASATGGEPLQYQWLLNGNAISGATNSTYGSANAQPADAGSYSVIVSNRAGSVTSGKARLVVLPYITAQPTNEYNLLGDAVTLTLTAIAPSSEGNLHSLWYYKGDSYRPTTASQTDDGTTKTLVSTFTFKVGKNQEVIHAWIDNNDGGTNSETVTINQGTKNPLAITIFSPVNNSTITNQTSATVSAEATTPNLGAAVTNISYYANGALIGTGSSATLTGLTAGSHTVAVVAADSFGVLTTNSVTFNIAIYAPTVSVSAPSHGAINSPETITINTVITGPGSVQSVQLLANGTIVGTSSAGNNGQFTFSWTPATAGTFTLTAAATTSYGASGTSPAVNFLSYVPSPPVVTLTPASETLTNAASITLNASAVAQGVGNSITNITIFDGNTSLGSTLPIIISNPSGTHTYKAVASDQYGTQGSASSTIQFLAVTPIVSITAPPHGGLGTNQTITVNAANVPVQSVQFLVNGTAVATSSTGNNGVYSFTWSPSTAENYSLSASATTANNLTGTSSSTIFAGFVPAAPVVTLIPTGGIMTNVTTVSISANAIGETYPGIAITNLSIFDGTNLLVTANTGTASTTVTNPAAGTHTYSAVAADAYGVVGTITSTILFTNIPVGDLIPPIVTISGPTTGPEYLPQTFTVFASNPSSTVKAEKRGVLRGKAFFKSQNVVPNSNSIARFLLAQLAALAHLRRGKERRLCIFESNAPVLMLTCKSWRVFATRARFISGS